MAWNKTNPLLGYVVIYVANGIQIKKRVKKGDDCILVAPEVSKSGNTFLGWREDTRAVAQVLPSKICDQKGIILYAVWSRSIVHGGNISAGSGYWGYDTNPDGSGKNWSGGKGGDCDRRCGYNCGVTHYHIWNGNGWNEAEIDPLTGLPTGRYIPHPGWHGPLSANWTKTETRITVG
jgi:hypothetical protein